MVRIIKTGLKNLVTLSLKENILSFPSLCSRIQAICAIIRTQVWALSSTDTSHNKSDPPPFSISFSLSLELR